MPAPARPTRARALVALVLLAAVGAASCRSLFSRKYEYDEDVYLSLDGSATVYLNASVPALVALRGLALDVDPRARLDRQAVRRHFESPVTHVASVGSSRRDNRRYVHLRIEVSDVRRLGEAAPFSWAHYALEERQGVFVFRQSVGGSVRAEVGDVGWSGAERVAFRLHLPSRVPFHNAPSGEIERGNIIVWEQTLAERLEGRPLAIEVHMETASILARTLALFGVTILLAAAAFAAVIWLVRRRGRAAIP
jgi:hypothetical protein